VIIIGLTGSIAMGKSEVARILSAEGIPVFDSDQAVHALYNSKAGVDLLKPFVPDAIVDGKIHRPHLSAIVMKNPKLLSQLEKLVHAEVAKRRNNFKTEMQKTGHAVIVFDIPLLFEKQSEKSVDVTVVVSAPEQLQKQRALSRPGMTTEKLEMILSRQMPDVEKRNRADYIIENNGTFADLKSRTLAILDHIKKNHKS
jgi:dephospho-CoA kinase